MPYEDVEQTIQDDPEKVDDFNEALVNMVDPELKEAHVPHPNQVLVNQWSSLPIVPSLGTQCLN